MISIILQKIMYYFFQYFCKMYAYIHTYNGNYCMNLNPVSFLKKIEKKMEILFQFEIITKGHSILILNAHAFLF